VEHIRVNYILRGLRVPAGQHAIEFKFEPRAFELGKLASGIFSTIILLGLLGFVGYRGYQYVQNPPEEEAPKRAGTEKKTAGTTRKKPKAGRRKKE
ncbi:MAG: hypothetical protein J5I98_10335, partial [Phaeodactylibacter sp.]|nr:hypothetical protein [Phaeodactylibacter sp.]